METSSPALSAWLDLLRAGRAGGLLHDSGWGQGQVMVVTGRGAVEKSCVVIFESLPSEKVTMQLSKDTYCSDNDFSKGKWFMLVNKNQ